MTRFNRYQTSWDTTIWIIRFPWCHPFELWLEDVHFAAFSEVFSRPVSHLLDVITVNSLCLAHELIETLFKFELLSVFFSLVKNFHDLGPLPIIDIRRRNLTEQIVIYIRCRRLPPSRVFSQIRLTFAHIKRFARRLLNFTSLLFIIDLGFSLWVERLDTWIHS